VSKAGHRRGLLVGGVDDRVGRQCDSGDNPMNMDDLKAKVNSAKDSASTDVEQLPSVNLTPECAIEGEIVDIGFTGDVTSDQNIRVQDGRGGDFVFTLKNPTVVSGTLFEALGRRDAEDNLIRNQQASYYPFGVGGSGPSVDFRLVPDAWQQEPHVNEMVKQLDGDYTQVGISQYNHDYASAEVESFDSVLENYDRVEVFVGKQAGRMMIQGTDTALGEAAYVTDDGGVNNGIVEYPETYGTPEHGDGDPNPRCAGQPILHPELDGESVTLVYHFGDMNISGGDDDDDEGTRRRRKHFGDILWETDGHRTFVLTDPGNRPLDPQPSVRDRDPFLAFDTPPNVTDTESTTDGGTDTDGGGDTDTGTDGPSFNFGELGGGEDTGLSMSDLDPDTAAFVDQTASWVTDKGGIDGAFDDFESVVTGAREDGDIGEYTADELRPLIEERA